METHDGIIIVNRNMRSNIDRAIERRFDVCMEFSQPTREQRTQLRKQEPGASGLKLPDSIFKDAAAGLTGGSTSTSARLARASARMRGEQFVTETDVMSSVGAEFGRLGAAGASRALDGQGERMCALNREERKRCEVVKMCRRGGCCPVMEFHADGSVSFTKGGRGLVRHSKEQEDEAAPGFAERGREANLVLPVGERLVDGDDHEEHHCLSVQEPVSSANRFQRDN